MRVGSRPGFALAIAGQYLSEPYAASEMVESVSPDATRCVRADPMPLGCVETCDSASCFFAIQSGDGSAITPGGGLVTSYFGSCAVSCGVGVGAGVGLSCASGEGARPSPP